MPWWASSAGAVIAALATFMVSWPSLKPRQRLFATRLVSRWAQRAAVAFAIAYFVWVNVAFLLKDVRLVDWNSSSYSLRMRRL